MLYLFQHFGVLLFNWYLFLSLFRIGSIKQVESVNFKAKTVLALGREVRVDIAAFLGVKEILCQKLEEEVHACNQVGTVILLSCA